MRSRVGILGRKLGPAPHGHPTHRRAPPGPRARDLLLAGGRRAGRPGPGVGDADAGRRPWGRAAARTAADPHPPRPRGRDRRAGAPLARPRGLRARARRAAPGRSLRTAQASASRLYGDDMERLWGEVVPVPEERVHALSGGERIDGFRVAYTPGHASHHVAYLHEDSGSRFCGDVAGAARSSPSNIVLPPTPPPDIDLEAWNHSLSLVADWEPETPGRSPTSARSTNVFQHLAHDARPPGALGDPGSGDGRRAASRRHIRDEVAAQADEETARGATCRRSLRSTSGRAWTATGASARRADGAPAEPCAGGTIAA